MEEIKGRRRTEEIDLPPVSRTGPAKIEDLSFLLIPPLNATRGKILDEAQRAELIPTLKQLQNPRNVDMSKHCQYHRSFGHTTDGCQALKDKIKELIQTGHLCKFIQTNANSY